MSRTSQTHPLEIAELPSPVGGCIGLTFCPAKSDPHAMTGAWDRDLGERVQQCGRD
jgi:ADP-ribosyl-[dinitrogen reductase] hydrolase